jgi:hypothetical protein
MRQFVTITTNAFMELIRQPVFLLLMTTSAIFSVFLASLPYFGFGEEPKLVKDSVLAVMLLSGLLGAVLCASASLAREIRTGTALAVLAKPVGRPQFLLGKYSGLALALTLLTYVNLVASLLSTRLAYDAYGDTDWLGLGIFVGAFALSYGMAAFSNYFLRRPFVSDAVLACAVVATLAFVVINVFDKSGKLQAFAVGIDWRMIKAGTLVLFALWILAGVALLCSTRLEMISTLAVCSGVFLLGLMSEYLFGRAHGEWWANVLSAIVPNWQIFWVADALKPGKGIPWNYLGTAFGYAAAYIGAALLGALALFQDRELN